jgi:ketosteroid isomerase-like protein
MTSAPSENVVAATPAQRAVAEHLRLLVAGDIEAWSRLFAVDGVLTFPFAPAGMPAEVTGRPALVAHMRNFPETFDVRAVDLRFVESGDPRVAIAEFGLTGHAIPTGKPYEQRCISVVRTDGDGLITRYDDYWNPLTAIEALTADDDASAHQGVARSFGA